MSVSTKIMKHFYYGIPENHYKPSFVTATGWWGGWIQQIHSTYSMPPLTELPQHNPACNEDHHFSGQLFRDVRVAKASTIFVWKS